MKINSVEFENFYSYKKGKINFNKYKGLVGVEGINKDTGGSNGSGKSVILEAIVYGLFGKSIRKSTEDAMVNTSVGRKCVVKIKINDNIEITRSRKPTSLKFCVNGEDRSLAHASRTQEAIEKALGVDYKTFMAASVFGQHSNVDFLDATPDDKRKIINRFLNLDYIFDMKNKIKRKRSDLRSGIKECDVLVSKLERDIDKYEGKVTGVRLTKRQQEILEKYTLDGIIEWEKRNTKYSIRMDAIRREVRQLGGPPISKSKKVVREGVGAKSSWKCSECGTEKNDEVTQEFYDFCKQKVDKYEKEVAELDKELLDITSMIERLPCTPREYAKWSEQKNEEVYIDLLTEAKAERTALNARKADLEIKYDIFGFWDKAFSEKGLIRFVIRTVRDYLNTHCNYYLGYLTNGRITVEFDEELSENIEVLGKHRHYISLSGGERRKVNLAVMLGLQTLLTMSNGHQSSVLFFDEVAENLDEDGINGLYELLCDLKKDRTLFVITHNPHLAQHMSRHKKINITKEKGVSTIK
jgi:DNA repair exonuclease SbcCD ATPase subunit